MPLYVPRGGEQVFCQPLELQQVRFYSFLFKADEAALQALCDRYLNAPSGGRVRYKPLLPRVLLGVADIGRVSPLRPPDNQKGWVSEADVAFWVPLAGARKFLGIDFTTRLAWFLPYVFVDNAWAFACGREVYGFPKQMGTIALPHRSDEPALFTVDTLALEHFDPEAEAKVRRLLEVRRVDNGSAGDLAEAWDDITEVFDAFLSLLVGAGDGITLLSLGMIAEVFGYVFHREVPLVFLRQFRDVADGTQACYQAVVEAVTRVTHLRRAGRLSGDYRLKVSPLESHPVVQELGLPGSEVEALSAWYVDFDFILEEGRELWRAPTP